MEDRWLVLITPPCQCMQQQLVQCKVFLQQCSEKIHIDRIYLHVSKRLHIAKAYIVAEGLPGRRGSLLHREFDNEIFPVLFTEITFGDPFFDHGSPQQLFPCFSSKLPLG